MKTPDEMMDYFKSMPSKKAKANPYWKFIEDPVGIAVEPRNIYAKKNVILDLAASICTLKMVREFFRRYYEGFHSEAQVLCVTPKDSDKLTDMGIPTLGRGYIGPFEVCVMVLPQDNSGGTTKISESFWQNNIVANDIVPVARIHSHHVLDPYQSITDYSTLNSGTLEMVIGKIMNDELNVCYWLDVPGTDTKAQTFLAKEKEDRTFTVMTHIFNGPKSHIQHAALIQRFLEAQTSNT